MTWFFSDLVSIFSAKLSIYSIIFAPILGKGDDAPIDKLTSLKSYIDAICYFSFLLIVEIAILRIYIAISIHLTSK